MKTFKIMTLFLVLILLMAFSAVFPLLLSKVNDQQLLGQIHLQKIKAQENNPSTQYSMIDKLRVLYDKRVHSKDIVVVQNAQLSAADLEKLNAVCYAELQTLREKKLLPALEDGLSTGFEGSSFTSFDTSRPDLVVNYYVMTMYSNQYRISFTMDADTHKIYELSIESVVKPLVLDYDNAYLHWQDYIGLSLEQSDHARKLPEGGYSNDNGPFPPLNSMSEESDQDYPVDDRTSGMAMALVHDYTDGNQTVVYSFLIAQDKKSLTISWSFQ
ncbi:hypothetical protein OIN60_10175 [Paenibacillus sp. P96]|uniref:Uncharacterized protein n=1 Tax=Paenibacillus zeirhizosphaerae TaxID=2987519 RepID=A0ABT9FQZ0_9BACL|nr:hypothetical protein [Paenibacillus sp. P96]MDP4097135.1 hypothetical protein [Paenibacillus sp. P96]